MVLPLPLPLQRVNVDPALNSPVWFTLRRMYLHKYASSLEVCVFPGVVVALSSPTSCRRQIIVRPTIDNNATLGLSSQQLYAFEWPAACVNKQEAKATGNDMIYFPPSAGANASSSSSKNAYTYGTSCQFIQHDGHDGDRGESCKLCRDQNQVFLTVRQTLHSTIVKEANGAAPASANPTPVKRRRTTAAAAAAAAAGGASPDDSSVDASEEEDGGEEEEKVGSKSTSKKRTSVAAFGSQKKKSVAAGDKKKLLSPHDVFQTTSTIVSLELASSFYQSQVVAVPLKDQVWRAAFIRGIDKSGLHIAWFNLAARCAQMVVPWSACHLLRTAFEWHEIHVPTPHKQELSNEQLQFDSMVHLYPGVSHADCTEIDRLVLRDEPLRVVNLELCTHFPLNDTQDLAHVLQTTTVLSADGNIATPAVAAFFATHSLSLARNFSSPDALFSTIQECDSSSPHFKDDSKAWALPGAIKHWVSCFHRYYTANKELCQDAERLVPVYRYKVKFSIRPSMFKMSNPHTIKACAELFLVAPGKESRFVEPPPLNSLDGKKLTELAASHTHLRDMNDNKKEEDESLGAAVDPIELSDYQRATVQWMIRQETMANSTPTPLFQPHFEHVQSLAPAWPAGALMIFASGKRDTANVPFSIDTIQLPRVTGGYVADEMGLGKSVEFIALMLHDARLIASSEKRMQMQVQTKSAADFSSSSSSSSSSSAAAAAAAAASPSNSRDQNGFFKSDMTLIVMTTSLVGHWKDRFAKFAPQLRVLDFSVARQRPRTVEALLASSYDVVLVSKDMLRNEATRAWKQFGELECNEPWNIDMSSTVQYRSMLQQVVWRRVMLDEAHTHKSSRSFTSKLLASLNSQRRWCMSGTPVGQSASDIEVILDFLGISPDLRDRIGVSFKQEKYRGPPLRLLAEFARHNMVRHERERPYLGRAKLAHTESLDHIVRVQLSPAQQVAYDAAFAFAVKQLQEWIAQYQNKSTLYAVSLLLDPLLRMCSAGSLDLQVISRAVDIFNRRRQAARNARMDAEDADATAAASSSSSSAAASSAAPMDKDMEMMDRRLNEWHKEWDAFDNGAAMEAPSCPICLEDSSEKGWQWVQTPCAHFFCHTCVDVVCRLSAGASNLFSCSLCRKSCRTDQIRNVERPVRAAAAAAAATNEDEDGDNKIIISDASIPDNQKKLEELCSLVARLRQEDKTNKIVVTIAYGHTMALARKMLTQQAIPFAYMLSSFPAERRSRAVHAFEQDTEIPVLLMPMRSSAAGLSLGCANHMVILDTVTNLSLNKQAATRVTRFDQARAVHIHYFVTKNTIEERVFELIQSLSQQQQQPPPANNNNNNNNNALLPVAAAAAASSNAPGTGNIGSLCSMTQLTKLFGI